MHADCPPWTHAVAAAHRDVMSSRDVVVWARKEFKKGRKAQQVADFLATMALRRHTEDNVSVVVVDLGGGQEGWPSPKQARGKNPFVSLFMR